MVVIGNDTLPGTFLEIESASSIGASGVSAGTPVIVGQADLANGSASANTAHRVVRSQQASNLFGPASNSQLTVAVQDALVEGANPVFAIPSDILDTTDDLSVVSGNTYTLANSPVKQSADDVTLTVNSTTKSVTWYTAGDPSNASPGTDEALINPQTGKMNVDESMGNSNDSIDYSYADYSNTYDVITSHTFGSNNSQHLRDIVDIVAPVDEKVSVFDDGRDKINSMETNGWFAILVAGAGDGFVDDGGTSSDETASFSHNYDNSRVQLINPSRDGDADTIIGGYAGRRAALGIDSPAINARLSTANDLQTNLSQSQQENLVASKVNPIEERRGAARVREDYTTVADDNSAEAAWNRGFNRLVTDYIADVVVAESDPFIGEFNNQSVRNTIKARVEQELRALLGVSVIEAYSIVVSEEDAVTANVDVGIDISDPLRNVSATVAAGEVRNGVSSNSGA